MVALDGISFAKFSSNFAFSLWNPNAELQLPSRLKLCHFRRGRNIKKHTTEKEPTVLKRLRAPKTNLSDINSVYSWRNKQRYVLALLWLHMLWQKQCIGKDTPYSSFKSTVRGILLFDFFFFWSKPASNLLCSPECVIFFCDRHALSHQICVWGPDGGLCTGKHGSYQAVTASALAVCFYDDMVLAFWGVLTGTQQARLLPEERRAPAAWTRWRESQWAARPLCC